MSFLRTPYWVSQSYRKNLTFSICYKIQFGSTLRYKPKKMKIERILVQEDTNGLREFYSAIRKVEVNVITFFESVKDVNLFNGDELIDCIENPQGYIRSFYANRIDVPLIDKSTGLNVNKERFLNTQIDLLELPDFNRLNEISNEIKKLTEKNNISLIQIITKGDLTSPIGILNKDRIEAIADGRFREFAFSLEEKNFITAYKELIRNANHLQEIFNKNTGGTINKNDLFKQDGNRFNLNSVLWHYYKKDCRTRIKA